MITRGHLDIFANSGQVFTLPLAQLLWVCTQTDLTDAMISHILYFFSGHWDLGFGFFLFCLSFLGLITCMVQNYSTQLSVGDY